jgi:hypothetical protein
VRGMLERKSRRKPICRRVDGSGAGRFLIARAFDAEDAFQWTLMLRRSGPLLVPVRQELELVEQLAQLPFSAWPLSCSGRKKRSARSAVDDFVRTVGKKSGMSAGVDDVSGAFRAVSRLVERRRAYAAIWRQSTRWVSW